MPPAPANKRAASILVYPFLKRYQPHRCIYQPYYYRLSVSSLLFLLSLLLSSKIMEPSSSKPEDAEQPLLQPSPIRVLVQTLTHLVPSDGLEMSGNNTHLDKLTSILNRICRYHWNCDFDPSVFRWYTYGDEFGYSNRRCFFLLDYGSSTNDDEVPILSYEWTGESLYV